MIALPSASVPATVVRAEIDEILAAGEFSSGPNALQTWFKERFEDLLELLAEMFGIGANTMGAILVYCVYGLLALTLVWLAWRLVRARRLDRESDSEDETTVDPVAARRARVIDLRRAARAAREQGQLVLALRLFFTALVVGLGEKGDLDYRDAWTNRELLERGEPREHVQRRLAPLVRDLDARSFGGVPATDDDVNGMALLVDDLLGAETT